MDEVIVGFPEFWPPVSRKYKGFFDCCDRLTPILREILRAPVDGELLPIVCLLVAAAANSYSALQMLVVNGYGMDAMKIARSIYETELNIFWLKSYPEDLADFRDYTFVQQKQLYDQLSEEQKNAVPRERYDAMMADYYRVLERFASNSNKTRPRNEWCKKSTYERAREAEQRRSEQLAADGIKDKGISLYKTFYRRASSMHHMDIGGVNASLDKDMNAIMAPSWEHLDVALAVATACVLSCVSMYDEMAGLGMGERIRSAKEAYILACKAVIGDCS